MIKVAIDARLPDLGAGGVVSVLQTLADSFNLIDSPEIKRLWIVFEKTSWWVNHIPKNDEILKVNVRGFKFLIKIWKRYPKIMDYLINLQRLIFFWRNELDKILLEKKVDLVHIPYQNGINTGIKSIYHPHDFLHKFYPKQFNKLQLLVRNFNWKRKAKNAYCVVVENEEIKKQTIRFCGIDENKIVKIVTPPRLLSYYGTKKDYSELDEVIKDRRYFLYPANFWEHKNHQLIIDSLPKLREIDKELLIIFSGVTNQLNKKLQIKILENKLGENLIILNKIDDQSYFYLLKNCEALLFPSKFESYSLPIFEALFFKKNIICSNLMQFIEQTRGKGIYFDPNDQFDFISKFKYYYQNYIGKSNDLKLKNLNILLQEFGSTIINLYLDPSNTQYSYYAEGVNDIKNFFEN